VLKRDQRAERTELEDRDKGADIEALDTEIGHTESGQLYPKNTE
jgi:hypothetical protein